MSDHLGALKLSKQYYFAVAEPLLQREFSELYPRLATGLVGNGSDRFGFDDELSQDHDWGIDFYLWLLAKDKESLTALQEWKTRLFIEYPPSAIAIQSSYCRPVTALTVGDFYTQLIGVPHKPETLSEWIRAPEENFALAVNGEVFYDGAGEFTELREYLLRYYPEDIRRKRMAAACMKIAQTGQYNHQRMAKRADWVAVRLTLARFSEAAMHLAFMLNKVFRPYYKWTYRMLCNLPILGAQLAEPVRRLALAADFSQEALTEQQGNIAAICDSLIAEIHRQNLATSNDRFMTAQGEEIQRSIRNESLRNLPSHYDI